MAYRERIKISQMPPKGADLELTDVFEVSTIESGSYVTKSITGEEILNATSGGTQTLQSVTDNGNTTTNNLIVSVDNPIDNTTITDYFVKTQSGSLGRYTTIDATNGLKLKLGDDESLLKNTNVTNPNVILEFPNKATGSYTIATTSDLTSGYVPYTGATQNLNLGTHNVITDQVALNVSPSGTLAIGGTQWNNSLGSSETMLKGGSVVLKNGVDLVARVVNKVTPNQTLTKAGYKAVRVSGAQGQRLAVELAQANNDNNSADTIGLVTEIIATNQEGFIITVGQLEGVNTTGSLQGETWADGDVLYLSPTTAGALTNIKPNGATGHIVVIGYVEYAHANNGKIYVKIMNGWELDELHNVSITNISNGDTLRYNGTTSLWENYQELMPIQTAHEVFRGVNYANNSTTETTSGGITISTTGSVIARSVASTNYASKQIRKGFFGSVVSAGRYTGTRGSALLWYLGGGFRYVCEVYISDTSFGSGCRQFYGMIGQTTDLTYSDTVTVASMLNIIGVGSDASDTNLQVFHNDGSGTCTKVDLGVNFPSNRTAGAALTTTYSIELYNANGNTTDIIYKVTNNETGAKVEGTINTNLPLHTQGLNFTASRCMGAGITNTGQFDLTLLGVYSL